MIPEWMRIPPSPSRGELVRRCLGRGAHYLELAGMSRRELREKFERLDPAKRPATPKKEEAQMRTKTMVRTRVPRATMPTMSMPQALAVWADLEAALYGQNGYGGDVTEIYAYRLVGHNPSLDFPGFAGAREEMAGHAASNLQALVDLFRKIHPGARVDVEQGGRFRRGLRIPPFGHRIHLRVRATGKGE